MRLEVLQAHGCSHGRPAGWAVLWRRTWSSRVSLELRKGTKDTLGSARALMHTPSVVSDRLMLLASAARSPVQPRQSLSPLPGGPQGICWRLGVRAAALSSGPGRHHTPGWGQQAATEAPISNVASDLHAMLVLHLQGQGGMLRACAPVASGRQPPSVQHLWTGCA